MKKVFLLIVLTALLVALGFAQIPTTSISLDQTNIKGCLGGTDGNYTVTENNTGRNFRITATTVNLTPHVGHEVALTGTSSAAVTNSFAVTELSMISEHCAGAAAIPAAIAGAPSGAASTPAPPTTPIGSPVDVAVIPAVATAAPSTTSNAVKEAPVVPAAATTAVPAATASTPTETVDIPSAAATPDTTVTAPPETVSKNSAGAKKPKGSPAQNRTQSAKPEAAAVPAAATTTTEPASAPATAEVTPDATVSATAEKGSTLTPISTKPAKSAFGGSLWLLVSFVVLVLLVGGLAPLISRWRKQRILEKMGPQNLSFSNEATPTESRTDESIEVRKIA